MKICKSCIMPESYPGISFDDEEVCNFCRGYIPRRFLGESELFRVVGCARKERRYDCVVPLSGGKDSIFILYYVVKKLGLKAVAVNYDSGMQSELAIENMNNACKILEVPLISKKANKTTQIKRLRAMMALSERLGAFVFGCGGCVPVLQAITIGFARENNIPFVIDGGSLVEHQPASKQKKGKYSGKIKSFFKYRFYDLDFIKYALFLQYMYYNKLLNKEMNVYNIERPVLGYTSTFDLKGVKVVRFASYISLPELEIVRIIKENLDWRNPAGKDKRFDCMLHCLSDFSSLQKYGISSNGIVYSNMIRAGLMDRKEALFKEEHARGNIIKHISSLIEKLELKDFKLKSFKL